MCPNPLLCTIYCTVHQPGHDLSYLSSDVTFELLSTHVKPYIPTPVHTPWYRSAPLSVYFKRLHIIHMRLAATRDEGKSHHHVVKRSKEHTYKHNCPHRHKRRAGNHKTPRARAFQLVGQRIVGISYTTQLAELSIDFWGEHTADACFRFYPWYQNAVAARAHPYLHPVCY